MDETNSSQEHAASARKFISVLDVVNSVARYVPVDEFEKDLRESQHVLSDTYWDRIGTALNRKIQTALTHDCLLRAYRTSEAAAALEDYLHHETGSGPRWFDWGLTGRPRLSDSARNEAMAALVHLAQYDKRCIDAWRSGKLDFHRYSDGLPAGDGKFRNRVEESRLRSIGFEQTELVAFLDRNGIPYTIDSFEGQSLVANPLLFTTETSAGVEDSANAEHSQAQRLLHAAVQGGGARSLTTSEMAAAFGDGEDFGYKTGRSGERWKDYLQKSPPEWAKVPHIRVLEGKRGRNRTSRWNPLEFAKVYVAKQNDIAVLRAFNERFRKISWLEHWKADWTLWAAEETERLKDCTPLKAQNPSRKPA